jgi:uncharacterized protein YecE (DUF72 family)
MPVLIGTSGWHYAHWRPSFYPATIGPARWLAFYAERFSTVELNNAFYRLPERATFEHWRDSLPDDFVVAVKASRYLTHVKRLQDPEEPATRLLERATGLGPRLGPILLQLPPTLRVDPERLDTALAAFGGAVRLAVELRHSSWFVEEVREVLQRRGAALCQADGGPVDTPAWRTTDWAYVRFHGGRGRPRTCYTRRDLAVWAGRLSDEWGAAEDVCCYFNNDANGCALRDARWLARFCADRGRDVTRVPSARETRVQRSR